MAQRLVRLICQECREGTPSTEADQKKMREVGLDPDRLPGGKLWKGRGCEACFGTGFTGRTGIYEVMPIDEIVRNQIMDRVGSNTIKKASVERGMKTLRMDGIEKVIKGQTTLDEILKVTLTDIF
jgi:type II secretory ATPase GspE/PulE/Tfp pilus assembly ATPase PilB-like protein